MPPTASAALRKLLATLVEFDRIARANGRERADKKGTVQRITGLVYPAARLADLRKSVQGGATLRGSVSLAVTCESGPVL